MPRILIVEDDPDLRDMMATLLALEGFDIVAAAHGGAAVERLNGGVDAIILDLMMPVMDGYAVLAELAKDVRTAKVPVVVLSARALPDEEDRATEAGARRFLEKPFDPDALTHELNDLLAAG